MLPKDYFNNLFQVFVLSLVVATVSMTLSKAKIFKSLREFLEKKSQWLGELIHCPYCTSHWVALFFVVLYRPVIIKGIPVFDYIVTVFVVVCLASFWSFIICHAFIAMDSLVEKKQGISSKGGAG